MENFNSYMSERQTKWREKRIKTTEQGTQNGKEYQWILPRESWKEGLWSGIGESLPAYLDETGVQKHDGVHNLKSSWMQCVNVYFPFREDLDLIAGFLKDKISKSIKSVDGIEFEWEDSDSNFKPLALLGENGTRGQNQTSPDIAFLVNDGKGIILTENKLVEHSFYPCSGRKKSVNNPNTKRCMDFETLINDIQNRCYMLKWENDTRLNRKYWNYLKFSPEAMSKLKRCPASTSGYQLFRQQALAEALTQKYGLVISCVAYDARNQTLIESLRGTGLRDFSKEWGGLFEGKARFATFTHQDWVKWVREHDIKGKWKDWLEYVSERYGYDQV